MNKSFNVDINSFNNINDMDSIYAGNTPVVAEDTKDKTNTKKNDRIETNKQTERKDHTKTIATDKETGKPKKDKKGNFIYNKDNNYALTFKIDADIEDYLKNILWINKKNKNQYVNDLIRADMLKRLNLKDNATYEELTKEWEKYKKANNI